MKARPKVVEGRSTKVATEYGNAYIRVGEVDGRPFEVFITIGKAGSDTCANAEAIGRLVSLCLRSDIALADVVKQLKGIKSTPVWYQPEPGAEGVQILSLPDAVGWVLGQYKEEYKP